jgi:hypothetical protein
LLILDENTVKTYFWGDTPSRHEWLKNKCSGGNASTEFSCRLNYENTSRIKAYEKYFGIKPDEYPTYKDHDISKWSEATKYLGKSVEEIRKTEKFTESEMAKEMTVLTLETHPNSPEVSLYDTFSKRGVINSATLFKKSPTLGLCTRILQDLEKHWGKPSIVGNLIGPKFLEYQWINKNEKFKATLERDGAKNKDGGILKLDVQKWAFD